MPPIAADFFAEQEDLDRRPAISIAESAVHRGSSPRCHFDMGAGDHSPPGRGNEPESARIRGNPQQSSRFEALVPQMERVQWRSQPDSRRAEHGHLQGLPRMELAGLEPATSWVRYGRSGMVDTAALQGLHGRAGASFMAGIAADICRFSSFKALLTMSA
jgi:hypothetical protein